MSDDNPIHRVYSMLARWPGLRPTSEARTDAGTGGLVPLSYGDEEWQMGWTDGRVGPESELTKPLLKFEARRRALERQQELRIALNAAEADFQNADEKHRALNADLQRIDESFQEVNNAWLASPGSFSRGLGLFYLVVALILFVADIPLSLLAADGLGMGNVGALRGDWRSLWEPISFALGVTALGLFFKFIADFFFKPKYAKNHLMKALSFLLILVVLGVVGSNLYSLAKVRTSVKALQEARRLQLLGQRVDLAALSREIQTWAERSFICLTITLPLLGGICASTGYSRVESARRRKVLMKEREHAKAAADAALEQRNLAEARKKDAAARHADAQRLTEEAGDAAYAVYQTGFLRGFAVPETLYEGRPLHERVRVSVRRWLAIVNQRGEFDPPQGPAAVPAVIPIGNAPAKGGNGA